jgi:hypothetical protein
MLTEQITRRGRVPVGRCNHDRAHITASQVTSRTHVISVDIDILIHLYKPDGKHVQKENWHASLTARLTSHSHRQPYQTFYRSLTKRARYATISAVSSPTGLIISFGSANPNYRHTSVSLVDVLRDSWYTHRACIPQVNGIRELHSHP